MEIEVLADPESVARKAAGVIAAEARAAIAARGRFVVAISGGHTPWIMLRDLADEDIPWIAVHIVQVDERVAPDIRTETSLICRKACLSMLLSDRSRSMPCRLNHLI